jgi:hypothetical protein
MGSVTIDESPAGSRTSEPPSARTVDRRRAAMLAACLVPIVVAVVRALRQDWIPVGDDGLLAVRVADVGTPDHPWLGSWTSASLSLGIDVNNPAATYQYLLAPFERLFGPIDGIAIGVATINAGCVVGISVAARRIGGWAMERWMLVGAAVLSWSMGSELLYDIWQPHAMLFPVLLALVLCSGLASGVMWCLPCVAAVTSVIVQTHLGHAMVLLLVVVAALVMAGSHHRPGLPDALRHGVRSSVARWTLAVTVIVWAPAVIEQLTAPGRGNLSRLTAASTSDALALGVVDATRIVGGVVALPPWIARTGFADTIRSTPVTTGADGPAIDIAGLPSAPVAAFGLLAVLALLGASARWTRGAPRAAAALAIVTVVGAVVSLSQVVIGPVGFAAHHARWTFAVGAYVLAVLGWCASDVARRRRPAADRVATAVALTIAIVVSIANLPSFAHAQGPVADRWAMPALRRTFDDMTALRDGTAPFAGPILYDTDRFRPFEPYSGAVMLRLRQLGIDFRVENEGWVRQLGERRRADGTETWRLVQLQTTDAVALEPDACVISATSALTPSAEAGAAAAADRLAAALSEGALVVDPARIDDDLGRRLSEALGGDVGAARRLVTDGWLRGWFGDGTAVVIDPLTPEEVDADLALVHEWVESSVALVVEPIEGTVDGTVDGAVSDGVAAAPTDPRCPTS